MFDAYIAQCDEIITFERYLKRTDPEMYNEMALEAEQQEVEKPWSEWRLIYKKCLVDKGFKKGEVEAIREKKLAVHDSFIRCMTIVGELKMKIVSSTESTPNHVSRNS